MISTSWEIVHGVTTNRVVKLSHRSQAARRARAWLLEHGVTHRKRKTIYGRCRNAVTICVSLTPDQLDEIDRRARDLGISRSRYLVQMALA